MEKLNLIRYIFTHFWHHYRHETSFFRFTANLFSWVFTYGGGIKSFLSLQLYKSKNKPENILTFKQFHAINQDLTPAYYLCLLEDKLVFDRYMKSYDFPVAEMTGFLENGTIQWLSPLRKEPLENITRYKLDCFFKIHTKWGGQNVYRLQVSDGNIVINNKPSDLESLRRLASNGIYVMQKTVTQHPELSRLNPSSVNTIRMITIHDGIQVRNLANLVRMGSNNSLIDNISAGGLGCGIDKNGKLMKEGLNGWVRTDRHPDTGIVFEGFEIPGFSEALELVRNMHHSFHCFFIIGWDIAITEGGPVVIEGNPVGELLYEQHFFPDVRETYLACAKSYRKSRDAFIREFVLKDKDRW